MASLKGLVAIVSKLRAERTNLLNQLKNVDAALSVLGKLNDGIAHTAPRRTLSASVRTRLDLSELDWNSTGHVRTLEEFERHYIGQVLRLEGGHIESTARTLGIPRSSLYHKLKQYQRRSV
jgi:DNA-binding NtrC family response regulator